MSQHPTQSKNRAAAAAAAAAASAAATTAAAVPQRQHINSNLDKAYLYDGCRSQVSHASCARQSVPGRARQFISAHGPQTNFLKLFEVVQSIYLLIIMCLMIALLFFGEDRDKHVSWAGVLSLRSFSVAIPDTNILLFFAVTRFLLAEPTRCASTAGRYSMLPMNEAEFSEEGKTNTFFSKPCFNRWRAVATKHIVDLRQIQSHPIFFFLSMLDPDRLFGLLLDRRNSCSLKGLLSCLRIPC